MFGCFQWQSMVWVPRGTHSLGMNGSGQSEINDNRFGCFQGHSGVRNRRDVAAAIYRSVLTARDSYLHTPYDEIAISASCG